MKPNILARTVFAILLLGVGLALSSCVIYDEEPYYGHHDNGRHEGWGHDHDRWR